jgi:hypothetical protein
MTNPTRQIHVEGDPNAVDSFAACVTAVLHSWGSDVAYDDVEGLSGLAFSPVCNDSEDCIGWEMDGSAELRIDFLGECLGFATERVEYAGGSGWLDGYSASAVLPQEPAAYFARLRAAILAGKAVIPHSWPAWSVLTGWDDDLRRLPFATTPRFDKVVASIYPPWKANWAFILTPVERVANPSHNELAEAIIFGAAVASGEANTGDVRFGGAIFDTITANARQRFLCPSCKENGCMGRSFKRIANGQDACVHFLQEARQRASSPAGQAALDAVIRDYADMRTITGKYLDWPALQPQHDLPEFRQQIACDCETEKRLMASATGHLKELAAILAEDASRR